MKHYLEGSSPNDAYETWKREWKPPERVPQSMPGWCIVEFGPFGFNSPDGSNLWVPEDVSCNAMMVSDYTREVPCGMEVAVLDEEGTYFEWEGRRLCRVHKSSVEMVVLS